MLPGELFDRVLPLPGDILVERLEMPARRRGIILPATYLEITRANEAEVVIDSTGKYAPGQRVFLASSVQRCLEFGSRVEGRAAELRILWICTPQQIVMELDAFPEEGIEHREGHKMVADGRYLDDLHDHEHRLSFDEGDLTGPQ